MQLKSILNRVERIPGFVFENVEWGKDGSSLEISIRERKSSKGICSGCGQASPGYDRMRVRRFEYVPVWQIRTFFRYAMRRVECSRCGIQVERVPWAEGKSQTTKTYLWFLSMWARRMSWQEVAEVFQSSWQTVSRAVEQAVLWGREHVDLSGIESIGVDEILHRRGSKAHGGPRYLTVVYQIDGHRKRLLWIGKDRREESLHGFFNWFGREATEKLKFACSDMWAAYLKVIRLRAPGATQILDRFHVMAMMNKVIDRIRAAEMRELRRMNKAPLLTNCRWILLRRPENLTEPQHEKLAVLLRQNFRVVRAYLIRESFQRFWSYVSRPAAAKFLRTWCNRVMRSRIDEMKKIAKAVRRHEPLLLNWLSAKHVSVGAVEGLNNKAKVTIRKSYGFRSLRIAELALYHSLGDLPEPTFTHRFW